MLEAPAEFFNGEHNAGQRRVEGRRDTGRTTRQQEVRQLPRVFETKPAAKQVHQAGAHVRRWPLATHRCTSQQRQRGQEQFACRNRR